MSKKITITLEVDETILNGLNNAIAAYGDICYGLIIGTQVPAKFEPLKQKSEEEIRARFNALVDFYKKIEERFNEKQVICRGTQVVEGGGLENRQVGSTGAWVRIPAPAPTRRVLWKSLELILTSKLMKENALGFSGVPQLLLVIPNGKESISATDVGKNIVKKTKLKLIMET